MTEKKRDSEVSALKHHLSVECVCVRACVCVAKNKVSLVQDIISQCVRAVAWNRGLD